jgi:hypothetical protein
VVALSDAAREDAVARGDPAQFRERRRLGHRPRQPQRPTAGDARRHDPLHQVVERCRLERIEHVPLVGRRRAHVAADELGRVLEREEGRGATGAPVWGTELRGRAGRRGAGRGHEV